MRCRIGLLGMGMMAVMLADAGYCSAENLAQAATMSAASGTEFFIATGRSKHDAPLPASPRGRIPACATPRSGWPGS